MSKKRQAWEEEVLPLNPNDLIFIDESGANLSMSSQYGRAEGGTRVKMPVPFDRGNTFSMIGAISTQKVEAAVYGEWATDSTIFLGFIETLLVPQLRPSHIVIMDNVKFHLQKAVKEAIEATGANVLFLPAYSPDLSPIEPMWSKIKSILRKLAPRTVKEFKKAVRFAFKQINKNDLINWYKHCGYFIKPYRIPL
jgi:transposase